jgi:hypothetical protein
MAPHITEFTHAHRAEFDGSDFDQELLNIGQQIVVPTTQSLIRNLADYREQLRYPDPFGTGSVNFNNIDTQEFLDFVKKDFEFPLNLPYVRESSRLDENEGGIVKLDGSLVSWYTEKDDKRSDLIFGLLLTPFYPRPFLSKSGSDRGFEVAFPFLHERFESQDLDTSVEKWDWSEGPLQRVVYGEGNVGVILAIPLSVGDQYISNGYQHLYGRAPNISRKLRCRALSSFYSKLFDQLYKAEHGSVWKPGEDTTKTYVIDPNYTKDINLKMF